MILHPSGKKLYLEAPEGKVKVLDLEKLKWIKEISVNDYFALSFTGFINDGKYLICGHSGWKGFIVINTVIDELEEWTKQINVKICEDYKVHLQAPFALSEDKTEIYIAIDARFGDIGNVFGKSNIKAEGGVVAINLPQKKISRILGLSPDSFCTGTVVINNKLFVSSWKDIFVIDIDRWRQEQ